MVAPERPAALWVRCTAAFAVVQAAVGFALAALFARTGESHAAVFGAGFVRDMYADAGVSFERSRVVHNGVRQEERPDAAFRDRARLVRDGELRLLFAGRLVDLKGAHDAVAAMPLIHPEEAGVRDVRLTLLGDARDAAYAERLRREVAASGCADRIETRPPVAEDALFDLFQQHDIYVFPSLYEPFSLTLIHALACGIPTVASRAGGNVEIVRDGESGVLFEKGDPASLARAVLSLARDPALRDRFGRAGRRRVLDHFSWDAIARTTLDLYRSLVDARAAGTRAERG